MSGISKSVGDWNKGAKNLYDDVLTVQELLTAAADKLKNPTYDPHGIDGKIGRPPRVSSTVKALKAFQKRWMKRPDGIASPGYRTITELASFGSLWSLIPDPADILGELGAAYDSWMGGHGGGGGMTGPCFPLSFVPKAGYHKGSGGRWFGAMRKVYDNNKKFLGYRKHAACDLIAGVDAKVYAVDDGVVTDGPKHFFHGTDQLTVKHTNFTVRYCEIMKKLAPGIKNGVSVSRGQHIAYVGQLYSEHMLHFEMYSGTASGLLSRNFEKLSTKKKDAPFRRRKDLLNPTAYLNSWKTNLPTP